MSRTKRNRGKPCGYDYWSKRPCSMNGTGPDVKQMTKEKERMRDKTQLHKELKNIE